MTEYKTTTTKQVTTEVYVYMDSAYVRDLIKGAAEQIAMKSGKGVSGYEEFFISRNSDGSISATFRTKSES